MILGIVRNTKKQTAEHGQCEIFWQDMLQSQKDGTIMRSQKARKTKKVDVENQ